MALNPVQFLVYPFALLCCWLGRRAGLKRKGSMGVGILFALLAVPALCYGLYYLRLWDEPMWLYEVRSWRENWYLRRAIEQRGVATRLVKIEPPLKVLPHPAIAGVKLGGAGHFIAVLGEDAEGYLIADPLHGRIKLSPEALVGEKVTFTGFFLILER